MIYIFAATLMACGSQKSENGNQPVADTTAVVTDTVAPKDSLAMVEEEDKLLKTLLPDLCSRKFPTAEEMKMWDLVIDKDVEYKKLPVLARALVRAYFGKQFWGWNGDTELKCHDDCAFAPVNGDFYATGDEGWYGVWPKTVVASSISHNEGTNYDVKEIVRDGVIKPWCSAVGKAEGATVTCKFKLDKMKPKLTMIDLNNGFCHTEKQWKNHGRVAKLQLLLDGKPLKTYDLEDTPDNQVLDIKPISPKNLNTPFELTFKVLKVYPGAKYNDVSISFLSFSDSEGAVFEDEESKESY